MMNRPSDLKKAIVVLPKKRATKIARNALKKQPWKIVLKSQVLKNAKPLLLKRIVHETLIIARQEKVPKNQRVVILKIVLKSLAVSHSLGNASFSNI
ncbi:hypothetical protein D3C87_1353230 [compost metagenome]